MNRQLILLLTLLARIFKDIALHHIYIPSMISFPFGENAIKARNTTSKRKRLIYSSIKAQDCDFLPQQYSFLAKIN